MKNDRKKGILPLKTITHFDAADLEEEEKKKDDFGAGVERQKKEDVNSREDE